MQSKLISYILAIVTILSWRRTFKITISAVSKFHQYSRSTAMYNESCKCLYSTPLCKCSYLTKSIFFLSCQMLFSFMVNACTSWQKKFTSHGKCFYLWQLLLLMTNDFTSYNKCFLYDKCFYLWQMLLLLKANYFSSHWKCLLHVATAFT